MSIDSSHKGILLEVGTNEVEFLLFKLGVQYFGINVGKVCQIILYDETVVVPLPHNVPELQGVMKFRDKTISIVDLKVHLGLKETGVSSRRLLLVTEFNQRTVGFVIDAVERIERCSWKQFVPVTDTISGSTSNSVVGTVTLKDIIVLILDLETIMTTIDPSMGMEAYQDKIDRNATIDRSQISILHCEDSIVVQKTLTKTLESAGFKNIHTCNTGADGFSFLDRNPPPHVDIILSDIEMPKMDGLSFCKSVRSHPNFKNTPFVFFSSMINDQMKIKCDAVGGDACFSKPQIHLIVDSIERLLSKKK